MRLSRQGVRGESYNGIGGAKTFGNLVGNLRGGVAIGVAGRNHVTGDLVGAVISDLPAARDAGARGYDDLPPWVGVPGDGVPGDLLDDRRGSGCQCSAKLAVVAAVERVAAYDGQRVQIVVFHLITRILFAEFPFFTVLFSVCLFVLFLLILQA